MSQNFTEDPLLRKIVALLTVDSIVIPHVHVYGLPNRKLGQVIDAIRAEKSLVS